MLYSIYTIYTISLTRGYIPISFSAKRNSVKRGHLNTSIMGISETDKE